MFQRSHGTPWIHHIVAYIAREAVVLPGLNWGPSLCSSTLRTPFDALRDHIAFLLPVSLPISSILPPQFTLLPSFLAVVRLGVSRGLLLAEAQVLELVLRHQIPKCRSPISELLLLPQKQVVSAHLSIRQDKYAFARFLHSGSFIPLTFFMHDK